MGGGGSSSGPPVSAYNFDQGQLNEFAKTKQGTPYADQIAQTGHISQVGPGGAGTTYRAMNASATADAGDATQMVADYTAWLQSQNDSSKKVDNYRRYAAAEAGRNSTILTGPAAQTILGGR